MTGKILRAIFSKNNNKINILPIFRSHFKNISKIHILSHHFDHLISETKACNILKLSVPAETPRMTLIIN